VETWYLKKSLKILINNGGGRLFRILPPGHEETLLNTF
jgi:2-succinyl-5-enolpyruvyl-6-hydroxy-3-cyclohexene-1-carboxylate synthase